MFFKTNYIPLLVLALLVCAPLNSLAVIESRPLNTSEPTLLGKRQVSIPSGFTFIRQQNNDREWDWVSELEYGFFDWIEYDIEFPYRFLSPTDREEPYVTGLGDIAMLLAVNPIKETKYIPAMSLAGTMKLNNGNEDRDLGTGRNDYTITWLMSKQFQKLTAVINFGYKFVGKPPDTDWRNVFQQSYALKYQLTEALVVAVEMYGELNQDKDAPHNPWMLQGGAMYAVAKCLTLDVGVGTGFNSSNVLPGFKGGSANPDLQLTSGATLTF